MSEISLIRKSAGWEFHAARSQ